MSEGRKKKINRFSCETCLLYCQTTTFYKLSNFISDPWQKSLALVLAVNNLESLVLSFVYEKA
jgi:hypothetical protein